MTEHRSIRAPRWRLCAFCLAIPLLAVRPARAASFAFDCGTDGSAVAKGWTKLSGADLYGASKGYGWEGEAPQSIEFEQPEHKGEPHHRSEAKVFLHYADDLKRDAVVSEKDIVFRADVPNGEYRVSVLIGDLRETLGSIDVYVNGTLAAGGVSAWAPRHRSLLKNTLGWWTTVRAVARVQDGAVRIRLAANEQRHKEELAKQEANPQRDGRDRPLPVPFKYCGFPFTHNAIMGIEIAPWRPAPVTAQGDRLTLGGPAGSPALTEAIGLFNEGKYEESAEALDKAKEPGAQPAKALMQLWLVGRLEIEKFKPLLAGAIPALQSWCDANPKENGAVENLNDAKIFADALQIHENRGNITYGEGHFGENSRAIGWWWLIHEDSPVYYRAQLFIARASHMLMPYLPTTGEERAIFERLARKFPDNRFVKYQLTQEWTNYGDGSDYYDWVWNDYTRNVEKAPEWVQALYPAFQNYVDWSEWWYTYRQRKDGSLGGGWGDDVEIIGVPAYLGFASPDVSKLLTDGTRKFMDGLWNYSEIDPELGFYTPLWDAEHAAEWTGNSLGMISQIDYGNPVWIERCMKTGKLLRDTWTSFNASGTRQFRANYLAAATVGSGGQANDSWINYRAIRPASAVLWYNQNPGIAKVFVELAETWLNAGLSTERGKPKGVIPANLGFPDMLLGGVDSPAWWQNPPPKPQVTNDSWAEQGYKEYIYDLLMTARKITGDDKFLEPLRLEYELASKYGNVPAIKSAARLQAIPTEEKESGGDGQKSKKERDAEIDKLEHGGEEWVAKKLGGVDGWLVAQRDAEGRKGPLQDDITQDDIVRKCKFNTETLRKVFPMFTTEAGPTDRIAWSGCMNTLLIMTGGRFGGPMIECAVTYRNTTRDFAAAVMGTDAQGFRLLYYSMAPDEREISLVPWQLEPGGRYSIQYGPDADGDDKMDSVSESREFDFPYRGIEVKIRVKPRVPYVVAVDQTKRGRGFEPAPDPGLSADDIRYAGYARQVLVRVHNVGAKPVRDLEVALYLGDPANGGKLIEKKLIPHIEAPNDITPQTTTVGFIWKPVEEENHVFVVLDPDHKLPTEITTFNNAADKVIHRSEFEKGLDMWKSIGG